MQDTIPYLMLRILSFPASNGKTRDVAHMVKGK